MGLVRIFSNQVLWASITAWGIAQITKVWLEYIRTHRINWALLFSAGGMPSSHSALVAACAHGVGLYSGFDTPTYALGVALAIVVIYDATGIRRQAGRQAVIINAMINDLASGHPLKTEQLREMLGHTPLQAVIGTILGLAVAQLFLILWK
jgi:acid phosphatase family membrane protein YuiD